MIGFGGIIYYLDMDALDKAITLKGSEDVTVTDVTQTFDEEMSLSKTKQNTNTYKREKEINAPKYDVLRMMIETLIDYDDESDETLGADRALEKMSLSYKLAFNTLYECGVLKEKEEL